MKIEQVFTVDIITAMYTFIAPLIIGFLAIVFLKLQLAPKIRPIDRYKRTSFPNNTPVIFRKDRLSAFVNNQIKFSFYFIRFWVMYKSRLKSLLHSAGCYRESSILFFMLFKLGSPFVVAFIMLLVLFIFSIDINKNLNVFSGIFFLLLAICYIFPNFYLAHKRSKRYRAIQDSLPDTLDLLTICAEAGMSLDASLQRVSLEINLSAPEIAEELRLTCVELSILPERRQALIGLTERCRIPALKSVINILLQAEKYGTSLSQSFRVASNDLREQRMLKIEEKAARLPAILTIPVIVFILPALFIVLVGPAVLDVYDHIIK